MKILVKNALVFLSVLATSLSNTGDSNLFKEKSKIRTYQIYNVQNSGILYKKIYNKCINTKLNYDDLTYKLIQIDSNVTKDNYDVTIITYVCEQEITNSKTLIKKVRGIGNKNIGVEYSAGETTALTSSLSSSITETAGVDADFKFAEVSASISYGIGAYLNASLEIGTSSTYSISYSFKPIDSSDYAANLSYNLYKIIYDYYFINLIMIKGKEDVYMQTIYSNQVRYKVEKTGGK